MPSAEEVGTLIVLTLGIIAFTYLNNRPKGPRTP